MITVNFDVTLKRLSGFFSVRIAAASTNGYSDGAWRLVVNNDKIFTIVGEVGEVTVTPSGLNWSQSKYPQWKIITDVGEAPDVVSGKFNESKIYPINFGRLVGLDAPTDLTATNITGTSADLGWSNVENASNYRVDYRIYGDTLWQQTTSN